MRYAARSRSPWSAWVRERGMRFVACDAFVGRIRVTRRANVILNDAFVARANARCARAGAVVMVWGVVVRDRARAGAGAGRARVRGARAALSPLSDDATGDLARARRASRRRVACGGGSRARAGGGVEDICLHACASRTRAIARRGGRGRGE